MQVQLPLTSDRIYGETLRKNIILLNSLTVLRERERSWTGYQR